MCHHSNLTIPVFGPKIGVKLQNLHFKQGFHGQEMHESWNLERAYEGPFLRRWTCPLANWPMEVPDQISCHRFLQQEKDNFLKIQLTAMPPRTTHPTIHWHFWHGHISKFKAWLGPCNPAGFPNWNLPSPGNFRVLHLKTPNCPDVGGRKSSALQATKQSKSLVDVLQLLYTYCWWLKSCTSW